MSERMTSVHVDGMQGIYGYAQRGRKTHAEMVKELREYAQSQKERAEKVLSATDDQFIVETYVGVHACRNRERVMP